jgi:hypothetical protein
MKKTVVKSQLVRVQTLIENDRLNVGRGFMDLLLSDLSKLLFDYFDFNGAPQVEIQKNKGEYIVNITLNPVRIKTFNQLID